MREPQVFDPRSKAYKEPYGAVICGGTVTLTCRPLAKDEFQHCSVITREEFSGLEQERELRPEGIVDGRMIFQGELPVPREPELVWYSFRFWRDDGSWCFLDQTGYHCKEKAEAPWQMTVYEDSAFPEWFGAGVTYQIFPDRFCRLKIPNADGLVGNRWVHQNWDEGPAWWPDEDGEIRNRDFFGGSLEGVISHLEDLAAMGVTTLYFCPIFESASNHRYNTADYTKIDPMLGSEEDFRELCEKAKEQGIRVVLDGVFNHIGSQSRYFNADGFYDTVGAAQSLESPWIEWFDFTRWPDEYASWWGIRTLPNVREECPSYVEYMITGEDSIVKRWLRAGASGWRLDVADELPDSFIEKLRKAVDETKPDALLLGEVWEDASNKISYSQRRRYLLGRELHGVMNYPFRNALLSYLTGGGAEGFQEAMETLRENYPRPAFYSCMNFLGTHDTSRALTVLSGEGMPEGREAQSRFHLSAAGRERGLTRLFLATGVLFTFPGSPMIYYGDEAGMEGCTDPFNRGTYPWGSENRRLLEWHTRLGTLRQQRPSLQKGELYWLKAEGPVLVYLREYEKEVTITAVNAGPEERWITLPIMPDLVDLMRSQELRDEDGGIRLILQPNSVRIIGN